MGTEGCRGKSMGILDRVESQMNNTKNHFLTYDRLRATGFNMNETREVCDFTGLDSEIVKDIERNYKKYAKKYL